MQSSLSAVRRRLWHTATHKQNGVCPVFDEEGKNYKKTWKKYKTELLFALLTLPIYSMCSEKTPKTHKTISKHKSTLSAFYCCRRCLWSVSLAVSSLWSSEHHVGTVAAVNAEVELKNMKSSSNGVVPNVQTVQQTA